MTVQDTQVSLDKSISGLNDLVDALVEKLSPITAPYASPDSGELSAARSAASTISLTTMYQIDYIDNIYGKLDRLHKALDL